MWRRALAVLLVAAGCVPHSRIYTGSYAEERKLLAASDTKVFPGDVRAHGDRYAGKSFAWAGIIKSAVATPSNPHGLELRIVHHYWDFVEDHSIQRAKAFLSPRGEGEFSCRVKRMPSSAASPGQMVVAYVRSPAVENGLLQASCNVRVFPPNWHATDIFDYGRKYLLEGDRSDFKMLRVPMN